MFERLRKQIFDLFFVKVEEPKQEATSRDPERTAIKRVGYAFVKSGSGEALERTSSLPPLTSKQSKLPMIQNPISDRQLTNTST